MINERIFFSDEGCGFNELARGAAHFKELFLSRFNGGQSGDGVVEPKLYFDSVFGFACALFGAAAAGIKASIVSRIELANITDSDLKLSPSVLPLNKINSDYQFYIYTSGSSGTSKKIAKSLNELFSEAEFLRKFLNISDQKIFSSVTHQHMFGLTFKLFLPLIAGLNVSTKRLEYPELINGVDFTNAIFISSPVVLATAKRAKIDSLKSSFLVLSAGSKLENDLRDLANICEIYGGTETGIIAADTDGDGLNIFEPVEAKIVDEKMHIKSPWCGGFISSDMVELNGDKIKLLGRLDRIVKLNEFRFNLDQAQSDIKSHEFISDAKCALLEGDNRIKAIVVLNEAGKKAFLRGGRKSVIEALNQHLMPIYRRNIRHFKFVKEIKQNLNGKFSVKDFEAAYNEVIAPDFQLIYSDIATINGVFSGKAEFSAIMDIESFFYAGHFRDFALTPGFMQLRFIFDCLAWLKIEFNSDYKIENLKYLAFLRPLDECKISFEISSGVINFKAYANENLCCSGKIR